MSTGAKIPFLAAIVVTRSRQVNEPLPGYALTIKNCRFFRLVRIEPAQNFRQPDVSCFKILCVDYSNQVAKIARIDPVFQAKEDLDNFMHLRRAVRYFLNTGVFTTVSMEYGDGPQEDDLKGDEFSTRVRDVISVKDNKHSVIDNHIERNTIIERYTISRLKGDWEALTGVAWKYGKEESNTSLERPEEKERGAIANSCKMEWSSAQRRTVVAMLMYVVLTEGREPLPEAIRPAPIRGGVAAGVWTWTIVQDCQTRHDGEGLARTKLLIANLDKHKFLPKAVIGTELEMPETNLRASTKMLQEFQEEHRGDAYMAVDSIGELASYSGREVFLLLLGLVVACGGAWALNTGAGFFLLAVLCANRLEQEINFKLFMFVWDRWLRSRGREPVVARPSSDIRANYCMVAGFGVVEALFDDERISVVVGKVSAIVLTAVVFVVALPPALFVWTKRRESNYKGPYPLVSPERQDWIRNSVGVFYGSCSECFFGGAGRGYRGADAQGGRLLNWLAGCSVNNVMWTGTSAGGVHHSIDTKMEHGGWWAVVG